MKQSSHATSLSGKNVTVKDRKLAEKFMRVTANPNMTKGEDNDYMVGGGVNIDKSKLS